MPDVKVFRHDSSQDTTSQPFGITLTGRCSLTLAVHTLERCQQPSRKEQPFMRVPDGVGWTAVSTAIARAAESRRPDRLFNDPFAEALVDLLPPGDTEPVFRAAADPVTPEAEASPRMMTVGDLTRLMPARTHYLDVKVLEANAAGCGQVAILAAGLDSRAYRLPWASGTTVFMLDTAEVTAFRRSVAEASGLQSAAKAVEVVADLTGDWPGLLVSAGFDPAIKTVWLAEGILSYLTMDQAERLMTEAARLSAPGSWLLTHHLDAKAMALVAAARESADTTASHVARHRSPSAAAATPPGDWLPRNGWDPETTTLSSWARQQGRKAPAAVDESSGGGLMWLITARRRAVSGNRPYDTRQDPADPLSVP
jgi:methyltransferase (TIGR00027 family)